MLRVWTEAALEDAQLDPNCDVFSDDDDIIIIDEVLGWLVRGVRG